MRIHSQFPPDKPVTQQILRDNGVGAIVAADLRKIYGLTVKDDVGAFGQTPDFKELDRQLDQAKGIDVHVHPIVCRYPELKGRDSLALKGRLIDLAKPIVDHCVGRGVRRITLVGELILCGDRELWAQIVDLYWHIKSKYPNLELWASEYKIRQQMDRDSILVRLSELSGLTGFSGADYTKLYRERAEVSLESEAVQCMKVSAIGLVSLARLNCLPPFWRAVQAMGLKNAFETSAFSAIDLPIIRKAQCQMYLEIIAKCKSHGVDLWLWNLCEESSRDHQGQHTYSGVWEVDGSERLDDLASQIHRIN